MKSIRRHLTLRLVFGTSLLAIGGLLAIFVYLRAQLLRQFDDSLLSRARTLASLVHVDDDTRRPEFELAEGPESPYGRTAARPDYFQIWEGTGKELARSTSLISTELSRVSGSTDLASFFNLRLPDGRRGRAVELRFEPGQEEQRENNPGPAAGAAPTATLVLASDVGPVHATLRNVFAALVAVMAAVALGAVWIVVATVRRGLRPLRDIGDAVARVDPMTLDSRFDSAGLPDELRPVAQKLDELLKRLDETFRRERRFTSNVAHELRTPIAELRTLAEVALQWPVDVDAAANARNYHDVLNVARQMEAVVSALLSIARCQAGHQALDIVHCDLSQVVADAWRPHAAIAQSRGLQTQVDIPEGTFVVAADRAVLTAMLQNLFANAVAYCPAGGHVACHANVTRDGQKVLLEISNTNRTLTPQDLPLLTEPFWRKDPARTNPANSGLGLTLVSTYAKLLNVDFSASLPSPEVFEVRLEMSKTVGNPASGNPASVRAEAPPVTTGV